MSFVKGIIFGFLGVLVLIELDLIDSFRFLDENTLSLTTKGTFLTYFSVNIATLLFSRWLDTLGQVSLAIVAIIYMLLQGTLQINSYIKIGSLYQLQIMIEAFLKPLFTSGLFMLTRHTVNNHIINEFILGLFVVVPQMIEQYVTPNDDVWIFSLFSLFLATILIKTDKPQQYQEYSMSKNILRLMAGVMFLVAMELQTENLWDLSMEAKQEKLILINAVFSILIIFVIRYLTSNSSNKFWVVTLLLVIFQSLTGFMMDKVAMLSTKVSLSGFQLGFFATLVLPYCVGQSYFKMLNFFSIYQLISRWAARTDYSYFLITSGLLFFIESNYKVEPIIPSVQSDQSSQEFKPIDELSSPVTAQQDTPPEEEDAI